MSVKKVFSLLAALCLLATALSANVVPNPHAKFPDLAQQLKDAHAKPGSALDKLIRANQDFSRLDPRDASDTIVPPWLKVYWQKGHPEVNYHNPIDPTGGYPFVLKEVYEWMMTHQDFKPGNPEATMAPGLSFGDHDLVLFENEPHRGPGRISILAASSGTNVRSSGSQSAPRSESDIRINFWNPSLVIAASNNISSSGTQGEYYSSDGGVTWGQSFLPLQGSDQYHSDPTVEWTSDGTAWSTTMGINGNTLAVRSYRSTNNGATWSFDGTISGSQTNTDKQMEWIDHSSTSPYVNNNYVIWHNGNPAFMNHRTSSGWGTPIQVSDSQATGTCIGADVKTNSAGDVFGFFPDTGSRGIFVVKSTNGGSSYGTPVKLVTTYDSYDIGIPADASRRLLIYVSGGAYRNGTTNNVYALWTDLSGDSGCTAASSEPGTNASSTCKTRIWFARSIDGGSTWSARVKINNQSSLNDQFNPFLAVDETNGTIGAIYYDTVNDPNRKKTDVYYQMSSDGGVTWQTPVKVTTAMTDETATGADSGNQYGDYNSLSGYANKFLPSWTDRRNNGYEEIWTAPVTTSTSATYSISGSAGTSGATVSAGSAGSATSDSSNNYSIGNLAAGTYTVTPSKSGCTFSPTSQSVTITSANVGGINFTATCTSPDFAMSLSPSSLPITQGSSGSSTLSTTVSGGFNSAISLTSSGAPSGTTVSFSPSSIAAPGSGSSTVTVTVGSTTATGTYTITLTGTGGSVTHSTPLTLTVNPGSGGTVLTNGGFETGSSSGWTASGVTAVNAGAAHSGSYGAQLGSTSPSTDSSLVQTFNLPSGSPTLSFWYKNTCPDTVTYDWATATLKDNSTGTTATVLAKTCTTSGAWTLVNYNASSMAGHSVTLTLTNHDDNYSGDATYTTFDDVNVTTSVTYSISGSAGTSGATVTAGAASATSDSSNNYSIGNLAAGTYTVTPSKSGCTFSPASQSVTITSSSVSGINFTATCSTSTTLFSDGFESTGWTTAQVSGTAGAWSIVTSSLYPSISAHGGTHWADFNSYTSASGSQTRIYRSSGFAVASTFTTVTLKFWMYHDTGYSTYADKVQAQVSTNGTTWTNVGTAVNRYNGSTGWAQVSIDISAYKGQTVYLGFVGISAYGNDEYIDDVTVTGQ